MSDFIYKILPGISYSISNLILGQFKKYTIFKKLYYIFVLNRSRVYERKRYGVFLDSINKKPGTFWKT